MLRNKIVGLSVIVLSVALSGCMTDGPLADVSDANGVSTGSGGAGDQAAMNSQGISGVADFQGTNRTQAQLLAQRTYHFAFNSDQLEQEDKAAIIAQAHYLKDHPSSKILLAGNTDERGSHEYNIALGARRSASVAHLMLANGVKHSQIREVSYGAEKPVALGHNATAWHLNRRVDLSYLSGATS